MIGTAVLLTALSATPTTPPIRTVQLCALNMLAPSAEFSICIDGETEIHVSVSKDAPCAELKFQDEFSTLEVRGIGAGRYIAWWQYGNHEPEVEFTDDIPFHLELRRPEPTLEQPTTGHGFTITT